MEKSANLFRALTPLVRRSTRSSESRHAGVTVADTLNEDYPWFC